jgi:exodeoxyribonuclease V alpha subunit
MKRLSDGFLKQLFPRASERLLALFSGAAENGGLEALDFYTLRDLLDLSGYGADEGVQALLVCLFLNLREGSVCVEPSAPALQCCLDGLVDNAAEKAWALELSKVEPASFPMLIGTSEKIDRPVILQQVGTRRLLYFQRYFQHERSLEAQLQERLRFADARIAPETLTRVLRAVLVEHPACRNGSPVKLNAEQRLALALSLLRNFLVISGGPGTGKTSVVFAALRCLLRNGTLPDRIALACPTGRAAQRLGESLIEGAKSLGQLEGPDCALSTLSAQTIHRLLGYQPRYGTFRYHRNNSLPVDVLIVDEVSMVDAVLMARLLEATPREAKVILIGDKDQLPSVDAGSVLADLLPHDGVPKFSTAVCKKLATFSEWIDAPMAAEGDDALEDGVVILRQNYRSQKQIQEIAARVNGSDGNAREVAESLPRLILQTADSEVLWPAASADQGCALLELSSGTEGWHQALGAWVRAKYLDGGADSFMALAQEVDAPSGDDLAKDHLARLERVFDTVSNVRVLTLIREGVWGCDGINAFVARMLNPHSRFGSTRMYPGAPVLITSNDTGLKLFNGDVGVALTTSSGGLAVVFRRAEVGEKSPYVSFPVETLPSHELAYALTVHKSQGSEYDEALVVLPPKGAQRLLNRQMLYTALTRARHRVVICGSAQALTSAVARSLERVSGLSLKSSAD